MAMNSTFRRADLAAAPDALDDPDPLLAQPPSVMMPIRAMSKIKRQWLVRLQKQRCMAALPYKRFLVDEGL